MWNPFKLRNKNIAPINEKKSFNLPAGWLIQTNGDNNDYLSLKRALRFYDNAAPVATAIDWINDEFKTLSLILLDKKEVQTEADILTFLQQPNVDMTQEDFLENFGAYFLICNEVYIIATGNIDKPPAELIVVSPEYITVVKGLDGFIQCITVQQPGVNTQIFTRSDKGFRFYNPDKSAEIWQIKGFNAMNDGLFGTSEIASNGIMSSRGRSKLSSIAREIEQYIEIAKHNLSTLDNGLKPSGVITMPENISLTDEQFEKIREQVVNYYSGAENAGKVLILDNGMTFTPMSILPKDMDFQQLTKIVTITVFNRYKVPLPLVSAENMTLANMETAKLGLYDNCVIPVAHRLFRELTNFLRERFKLDSTVVISANWEQVSALQLRRNEQLKLKKDLNIYTTNEMRLMDGAEASTQKGTDDILSPWTLVPIGVPTIKEQLPSTPSDVKPTVKQFTAIMEKQLNIKGERIFNDDEIKMLAIRQGL